MASITKRGRRYQVKWREHGRQRSRTCPDHDTAKQLQREVERQLALHGRYRPPTRAPTVEDAMSAYTDDRARVLAPGSLRNVEVALGHLLASLERSHRTPLLSDLSRQAMRDLWSYLTGARGISPHTAAGHVRQAQRWWRWADAEYPDTCPRCAPIDLPATRPALALVAPTWAQMDAAVEEAYQVPRASGRAHSPQGTWYGRAFEVARATGLRAGQIRGLRWDDLDLDAGTLTVRGELGKSRSESRGRVIPLAPVLVESMAGWGRREGWLVPHPRQRRPRSFDPSTCRAIWTRTGAPAEVYRQPMHTFRKGFETRLLELGADYRAVEALVGHQLPGAGASYVQIGPGAALWEPMVAAVDRVPEVGRVSNLEALRGQGEGQ